MGTRILSLVRHGTYDTGEAGEKYDQVTSLGTRQPTRVGNRLASLDLHVLHHSDLLRAVETAEIIARELDRAIPVKSSKLLREGVPTVPCPWLPNLTRAQARQDR